MALFMIHDRVWFGSAESANEPNCQGHGLSVIVHTLDGQPTAAKPDKVCLQATRTRPPVPEDLRMLMQTVFKAIHDGRRLVFIDGTGHDMAPLLACAYLSLIGYSWDEAWAKVRAVNKDAAPPTEIFEPVRLFVREHFAVLK